MYYYKLQLAYLHYIKGPRDKFSRSKPAICNWGFDMVKDREDMELRYGGFGQFTLPVQEDIEEELRVEDTEVESTIEVIFFIFFYLFNICYIIYNTSSLNI